MKKIVIIGSSGAGKSTFARRLGKILEIEVFHLDRYFWQPEWKEKPRDIRREILQRLVQEERWIIEGTYLDTSDVRLRAADTIIFLDTPGLICFWRVLNRYFRYRKKQRPDLAEGCLDKLGPYYLMKVLGFPFFKRKWLFKWLCEFENEKRVVRTFRSKGEVEDFLWNLGQTQEEHVLEKVHISSAVGQ